MLPALLIFDDLLRSWHRVGHKISSRNGVTGRSKDNQSVPNDFVDHTTDKDIYHDCDVVVVVVVVSGCVMTG